VKKIECLHIVCLHTSYIKVYILMRFVSTTYRNLWRLWHIMGWTWQISGYNRYRKTHELRPPSFDTAGNNGSQDSVHNVATTYKVNSLGFESQQR